MSWKPSKRKVSQGGRRKIASNATVDQVGKELKTATGFSSRRSLVTLTRTESKFSSEDRRLA